MIIVGGLGSGSPFRYWLSANVKVKELKTDDITHPRNRHLYLNL